MNLVFSLIVGAVLSGQGQPSLYRQVIPNPTGTNGYEEYLKAADLVNDQVATAYYNGEPTLGLYETTPESIKSQRSEVIAKLNRADYLDAQRLTLQRYGPALDLVEAGNQKQFENVHDPLTTQKVAELRHFFTLGRLFAAKAYVQAAEGNQSASIHTYLDAMTFGTRIQAISGTGDFYGSMILTEILRNLKEAVPRCSLAETPAVDQFANAYLTMRPTALRILQDSSKWHQKSYNDALAKLDQPLGLEDDSPLGKRLANSTPQELRQILQEASKYSEQSFEQKISDLNAPEAEWYDRSAKWANSADVSPINQGSTPADIGKALVSDSIGSYRNYVILELRMRCQLRILDLYAAVVSFKWKKKRLPVTLDELGEPNKLPDPLTGAQFSYEKQGDGFRIYTKGRPETGEVDLDYNAPARAEKVEP